MIIKSILHNNILQNGDNISTISKHIRKNKTNPKINTPIKVYYSIIIINNIDYTSIQACGIIKSLNSHQDKNNLQKNIEQMSPTMKHIQSTSKEM